MVQKRPLGKELYEVSSKQPRHLEQDDKRVSVLEFPGESVAPKLHILGEDGAACANCNSESNDSLDEGNLAEFQTCNEKELGSKLPGSISNSSWATSTASEEDVWSAAPWALLSPNHYNYELPVRNIFHTGEIYSFLLEHPPRKLVPIGRDFQAEIPEWFGHCRENLSSSSGDAFEGINLSSQSPKSDIDNQLDYENKFAGSCLVPMPGSLMSEDVKGKLGGGRIDCPCDDAGSVRCVRQHISEAREKLRKTLGHETFVKLGFLDMGEAVAERWSEEEEEIFHEVVFSNPVSLGRNFWSHLAIEFPSRTKKEIVSYYFNVLMLRRRAEQNRVDALNVDSDNDEWERAISADEVIDKINGCDDSLGESPAQGDDSCHREIYEDNICEHNEDITWETSEDDMQLNLNGSKCISKVSDMCPLEVSENCSSDQAHQPCNRVLSREPGDHKVQDDLSTEETPITKDVAMGKTHNMKLLTSNLSGTSCNTVNEFLLEPCNSKEWDDGYLTCSKDEDLLPTCCVIEEVFGAGAWNYHTRDG